MQSAVLPRQGELENSQTLGEGQTHLHLRDSQYNEAETWLSGYKRQRVIREAEDGGGGARLLPWRPVYPESFYGDVRVLQVHTVCEERLDIVKVLWFEFGDWGESVVILLDQLSHKVLIKGQLVVPSDHNFKFVRKAAWKRRESREKRGWSAEVHNLQWFTSSSSRWHVWTHQTRILYYGISRYIWSRRREERRMTKSIKEQKKYKEMDWRLKMLIKSL